jgi:hypothetical protein
MCDPAIPVSFIKHGANSTDDGVKTFGLTGPYKLTSLECGDQELFVRCCGMIHVVTC